MVKMFLRSGVWLGVAMAATSALAQGGDAPNKVETAMVASVDARTAEDVALLDKLVDINSGTMDLAGVVRVKDVIEPVLEALGFKARWVPMEAADGRAGDLVAEHPCPAGTGKCGKKLLLIGHMDTVFELSSSFQKFAMVPGTNGRVATGPGVCDMKGGLVVMLSALKAMQAAGVLANNEITVVLSGDEEDAGRPHSVSRKDMIDAGKRSDVALEFENAFRSGGESGGSVDGKDAVRIGRRSSIAWKLETTGKTGHSSVVFGEKLGYGAIYEMARIIDQFRTELREPGLTYSVGLVLGGSTAEMDAARAGGTATGKSNVIAATAVVNGDIRTLDNEQTERVEKKMEAIVRDHLAQTSARIEFEDGYPAMGVTPGSEALLAQLQQVNKTLGYAPEEVTDPAVSGAGDIAFVAPYVSGLVGVGAMGTGAHAEGETVYLDSLPKQTKRMALLMYRLGRSGRDLETGMSWLKRLFMDRERFWIFAAVVLSLVALRKGFNRPLLWAATQAQVDYSHGFIKRGLFGTLVTRPLGLGHYARFAVVSTLLLLLLLGLFAVFAKRTRMLGRCGSAMPLAVFGSSFAITFLGNLNGYLDIPLGILTVSVLMVKDMRRRALLAVPVVMVAILIHEIFLLVFLPVIVLSFVLQGIFAATVQERRWAISAGLGVMLLAGAVTVVTAARASRTPQSAEALRYEIAGRVDFKVDPLFFHVFTRSAMDNVRIMRERSKVQTWRMAQVASLLILLPAAGLLMAIAYRLLKRNTAGRSYGLALCACVVATAMPLTMNVFGWDVGRWYALAGVACFLSLGMVCLHVSGPELDQREGFERAAILSIALEMASGGFLIDTIMRMYPFLGGG